MMGISLKAVCLAIHLAAMMPLRIVGTIWLVWYLVYGSVPFKILLAAYVVFFLRDSETPHTGGRRLDWFRKSLYWIWMGAYFPLKVVQTSPLNGTKNYIAVTHPHGVWFLAHTLAFAADIGDLEAKNGLRTFATTLNANFVLPFAREYLLASGFVSVSERSLEHILTDPIGGNLVSLVPGGSAEAGMARPGHYSILLRRRKGFCRVALKTGACLVPTIVFGEVDCYSVKVPLPGTFVASAQSFFMRWTGINLVLHRHPETGLYFLSLPKRTPITVILGEPIYTPQVESPTPQQIEELHIKYTESLTNLFEKEKKNYLNNSKNVQLFIQ